MKAVCQGYTNGIKASRFPLGEERAGGAQRPEAPVEGAGGQGLLVGL